MRESRTKKRLPKIRTLWDETYNRYAPREKPLPAPTAGIFDSPAQCIKINHEWIPHLIGAVSVLDQLDSWAGMPDEDQHGRQEIQKLLTALCEIDGGECDTMDCIDLINCNITQDIINNGGMEFIINDDGTVTIINPDASNNDGASYWFEKSIGAGTIEECDKDSLYAGIRELVERVHLSIRDVFQRIEVSTNPLEVVDQFLEIIDFVPGIGIADAIVKYLDFFLEYTKEQYDASYTVELEDKIVCELFCIASTRCEMNLETFRDYLWQRIGHELPDDPIAFIDVMAKIPLGTGSGDWVVYMYFAIAMALANTFNIVNLYKSVATLSLWYELGANDPSPDWELLCNDCADTAWCIHMGQTGAGYPNNLWNYDHITPIHGTAYPSWTSEIIDSQNVKAVWELQYPKPMIINHVAWTSNLLQTRALGGENYFSIELYRNGTMIGEKKQFMPNQALYANTEYQIQWDADEDPILVDMIRFYGHVGRNSIYGENATRIITETMVLRGVGEYPDTMTYENCGK